MLLQLDIHNIALIEEVHIELGEGLNILTGETGAGKSIIIDSINAILGERVSREIIRTGSDKALVEAVFQIDTGRFRDLLDELGMEPEEDGTLILSRELSQSGRNTCRVNGKMVAVSFLKAIGERLIDLHGQHDNQSLLKIENHIDLLDSFGGKPLQELKNEYAALLEQYREAKARLKALSGDPGERERKIDLLKFQIDEIKKAKLKAGEEAELNKQKLLLANAEKISGSLAAAYGLLYSGEQGGRPAMDAMNEALSQLNAVSRLEDTCAELSRRLQEVIYLLEDIAEDIRKNSENMENDPALLEEMEERLDLIYKLKRKYGASIADIQLYCENAEGQLDELEKSEETAALLRKRKAEIEALLYDVSCRLHEERVKASSVLEERIGTQLEDLEMKKARFSVDIQFDAAADGPERRRYAHNGLDRVEFLISANAGEPLKPLAKIASGGEMSRIMLAIKTILAEVDKIPTMICVTHLAQIAAMADRHYLIEKFFSEDSTKTTVARLDNSQAVKEIARLAGGSDASEASIKYAEEMLNNAKRLKKA